MTDDRINLASKHGDMTISLRHSDSFDRSTWTLDLEPRSPLDYGVESMGAQLDDVSIRRLFHFLATGVALTIDKEPPPLPAAWSDAEAAGGPESHAELGAALAEARRATEESEARNQHLLGRIAKLTDRANEAEERLAAARTVLNALSSGD